MNTFGEHMKDLFLINKHSSLLNHGSYGAVAKVVFDKRVELMYEFESQPDLYLRKIVAEKYAQSVDVAAKFVDADPKNIVIVDNATAGINSVFNSIQFKPGDKVLMTDHTYDTIQQKIEYLEEIFKIEVIEISLPLPLKSEQDLINVYKSTLEKHKDIKLAVVDHITGLSGLVQPAKEITKLLHEHSVMVIVDGAQAPGQIDLHVEDVGADFYVGNFHKWLYASHTSAFLWIAPKYHNMITPLVISKYHKQGLQKQFEYLGTRDTTNFFSIPTAIEFYNSLGGLKAITSYTSALLDWASPFLCEALNTTPLVPIHMRAPNILVILFPVKYDGDAEELTVKFFETYNVQVVFKRENSERMWIRMMANVYTTKNDFIRLKDALLDFCGMLEKESNNNGIPAKSEK